MDGPGTVDNDIDVVVPKAADVCDPSAVESEPPQLTHMPIRSVHAMAKRRALAGRRAAADSQRAV